jgi:hypothetical protein
MRLLDHVAQSRTPLRLLANDREWMEVTGAADFANAIARCPIRYVLADDLTRACAELAFADGDRLAVCLDLIRIPAPLIWVEWNDEVHQRVIHECKVAPEMDADARGRRVGMLLQASHDGRTGYARTFWRDGPAAGVYEVCVSPLEMHVDLRGAGAIARPDKDVFDGGFLALSDSGDDGVNSLLECVRLRFDPRWSRFYRVVATTQEARTEVVRGSLATVARDVPFMFALFLLMSAHAATRPVRIERALVNRRRLRLGESPLLDHVEVHSALQPADEEDQRAHAMDGERRPPRLHHVRGHLVRRGLRIYWRTSHLRGRSTYGVVRSRTVCLSFEKSASAG